MRVFPTAEKLYRFFDSSYWGYCLSLQDKCLAAPCIKLCQVDHCYGTNGIATNIIVNQCLGLYKLSAAKEAFTTDAARVAAELFLGMYGDRCNLYEMMIYFARYPMVYKSTFYQFDVEDILKQYGAQCLPWLMSKSRTEDDGVVEDARTIRGIEAHNIWVENYIRNGGDIRQGGLYRFGFLTEEEVVQHEKKLNIRQQ